MFAEIMDNGQIALPPAFMDQLKWKIGDKLNISVSLYEREPIKCDIMSLLVITYRKGAYKIEQF